MREATFIFGFGKFVKFVSIRASREGGDRRVSKRPCLQFLFQSAPPVREATYNLGAVLIGGLVSIRASREGGDIFRPRRHDPNSCFNPRLP